MKCYAIMHSGTDRQNILDVLDGIPEILNWRAASGAIFVVSQKGENWISDKIHAAFPDAIFLVATIDIATSQGYQDKETWEFIERPKPA
jgi:hypothetical protein